MQINISTTFEEGHKIFHYFIITSESYLLTRVDHTLVYDGAFIIPWFTPEVLQSPYVRLSLAFVVRGFISMISKVKMQDKIQSD